jgi:hypothetical protein
MNLKILLCIFLICVFCNTLEVSARRKNRRRQCEVVAVSDESQHESAELEPNGTQTTVERCVNSTVTERPYRRRQRKRKYRPRLCRNGSGESTDSSCNNNTQTATTDLANTADSTENSIVCPFVGKNVTNITENPLCAARTTRSPKSTRRRHRHYRRRCSSRHNSSNESGDKKRRRSCYKKRSRKNKHKKPAPEEENEEDDFEENDNTNDEKTNHGDDISDENLIK